MIVYNIHRRETPPTDPKSTAGSYGGQILQANLLFLHYRKNAKVTY